MIGQRGAWIFSTAAARRLQATTRSTVGISVSRISNGDVLDLNTYQITPAGECCISNVFYGVGAVFVLFYV